MKLHLECSQTVVTIDLVTRWRKQRRLDKTDFKSAVSTNFTIGAPAAPATLGQRNRSGISAQARPPRRTRQRLLPRKKGSLSFPCKCGAGNETFTKTVSRCFPITFFAGLTSEDLNCSLIFHPRQQVRPETSSKVQGHLLSASSPHLVHRRLRWSRTHQ